MKSQSVRALLTTALLAAPAAQAQDLRPDPGDRLGTSFAFGDFNGDGRVDVAVSAIGAGLLGQRSGVVLVFSNTSMGLVPSTALDQGMLSPNSAGDAFGFAMASGDFNGDGMADLAVGTPGETVDGQPEAGGVFLYQGSQIGLLPVRLISQAVGRLARNEPGDRFGSALAVGDFNGDNLADLAVGAPGKIAVRGANGSGAVFIFNGRAQNFNAMWNLVQADKRIDQESTDLDESEAGDRFGASLTAIDFDGDGRQDLAVGAPGDAAEMAPRGSGAVYLFRSNGNRMQAQALLDQEFEGTLSEMNEAGDALGSALAAGDFDGDGRMDLAVGVPGENTGMGQVLVYSGGENGMQLSLKRDGNGGAVANSRLGSAMAAGDFNGDGRSDLSVGAPGLGGATGRAPGSVFLHLSVGATSLQQIAILRDPTDPTRSQFGFAMGALNVDGDDFSDLVVGVPGANRGGADAGRVILFTGNRSPGLNDGQDFTLQSGTTASN
jgi:hypothetical protein